jgi:hypothetical protein
VERNRGTLTWDEFIELMTWRFDAPLRGNTLGEVIWVRWESYANEFQSKILSLLARCEGLSEKHQIDIFTTALRNPLNMNIELEHPEILEDDMALTRAYE